MSYNYDLERNEWDYQAEDCKADEAYDRKRDACAHFPKEIWDQVSHMNQSQAVMVGEELLGVYNNTVFNKSIVESIWGKERVA